MAHQKRRTPLVGVFLFDGYYGSDLIPNRFEQEATVSSEASLNARMQASERRLLLGGSQNASVAQSAKRQRLRRKEYNRRDRVRVRDVNEGKQLIIVFPKCFTEIRRNEANLRFARISTIFQEGVPTKKILGFLPRIFYPRPKGLVCKREKTIDNRFFEVLN